MAYRRRIVDEVLDELFPHISAISLEGAKGVGKTATASQRVSSTLSLTDPAVREVAAADFDHVTRAPRPVLVDEWQLVPEVWDRVRKAVDDGAPGGSFLLAGSADVPAGARIHSGAGRIVRVAMRPLSFSERAVSMPTVSLAALLNGDVAAPEGTTDVGLERYVDEILRSGFPGIRDLPELPRQVQLDSYLARVVEHELPESGVMVRRPAALRSWLAAYGAATATDASYTAILDAATAGEANKPARQTVAGYRDHLSRLFILDPVEPWVPAFAPLKRLTRSPKHHLVDPALAARLMGLEAPALLSGAARPRAVRTATASWLGALFESLVTQSVRVYADAARARIGHLRSRDTDREIDLIIERADHTVLAAEIKLSASIDDKDVRHLHWIKRELGDRVVDRIVINTGPAAYRRPDGIAVVPLALLGP